MKTNLLMLLFVAQALLVSCADSQKQPVVAKDIDIIDVAVADAMPVVDFPGQTFLAVACVPDFNEPAFAQKYFPNGGYDDMTTIDTGGEMRFVVIPKDENVKFSVYPCIINDEYEIEKAEPAYISNCSGCLKIKAMKVEYIPHLCIVFEYNGFEGMLPLTFEGQEGHLDLSGCEKEVVDVTIY